MDKSNEIVSDETRIEHILNICSEQTGYKYYEEIYIIPSIGIFCIRPDKRELEEGSGRPIILVNESTEKIQKIRHCFTNEIYDDCIIQLSVPCKYFKQYVINLDIGEIGKLKYEDLQTFLYERIDDEVVVNTCILSKMNKQSEYEVLIKKDGVTYIYDGEYTYRLNIEHFNTLKKLESKGNLIPVIKDNIDGRWAKTN